MSNPKISVVLPIYNVENYLEDTLNCLLNQTFIDNMEVLMIDDGSTDDSRYIIERYALDYDNFYAFHKKNEGPALTRNYGIDRAKGEYVHFLDADDTLANDGYEKLYAIATDTHSDIITAPVIRLRRYNIFEGKFYKNSLKKFDDNIYSTKFQDNPELIWDLFITNKLYKREFLNKNDLRHIVGNNAYCDDAPFSLKAYLLADDVSISKDIFYYWRLRENGNPSITQRLTEIKTFYDRLQAIELCLNVVDDIKLNESLSREFYLKFLNHDLYLHFSKFYTYPKEYHLEFIQKAKTILNRIPSEYHNELNSFKKIIYKMVEDEDIKGLVDFSSLESELKENPKIPENFDEKYVKYIDFNKDALDEDLIIRREEICLEDDKLIITVKKSINYLDSAYPHKTIVNLIDDEEEEVLLDEDDSKIIIPVDLIKDRNHMKIRIECIFDSFKKECYLTNGKREVFELDGFDIEIGIGVNNLFLIDIRPTNDLILEIEDVLFEDNVFKFSGFSNNNVSGVYIQNVVTFDKISYTVNSVKEDGNYKINFSIPYDDILSFYVRKWELKVDGPFKIIKLSKKFEFYRHYDFIYMINLRNKVLISFDFYNLIEKASKLKDNVDDVKSKNLKLRNKNLKLSDKNSKLSEKNKKLREKNKKLSEKNKKLTEKNKKLTEKNKKLKNTVNEYKSRKIVKFVDKLKH